MPPPPFLQLAWPRPLPPLPAADAPPHPPPPSPPISPFQPAEVRALTGILMAPTALHRRARHAAYCRQALAAPAASNVTQTLATFRAAQRQAWRLPCGNHLKEPLWRLSIDCVPGARIRPWRCPCDLLAAPIPSPRSHSFWDCPVASAVRGQLASALGRAPADLPRASIWLLSPPPLLPGPPPLPNPPPLPAPPPPPQPPPIPAPPAPAGPVHADVWTLVALAAIAAMEYGRALLWAHRHSSSWPDPGPLGLAVLARGPLPAHVVRSHILPHIQAARDVAVASVGRAACTHFWRSLQDFATAHPDWAAGQLGPAHPFLCERAGRLHVSIPDS
jgi:hypothetical protein